MSKYRKRPVTVEARRLGLGNLREVASWCGGEPAWQSETGRSTCAVGDPNAVAIETLEGTLIASLGDWVIQGVKGEFYPCKPDIFEATYEAVLPPEKQG